MLRSSGVPMWLTTEPSRWAAEATSFVTSSCPAVVCAGAGEENGLWRCDLSPEELLECDHRVGGCREPEHDGVADRLDELVVGAEDLLCAGAERLEYGDGFAVAMGLGDGGEAGEVDEREGGVKVGRGHGRAPTPTPPALRSSARSSG